jgi:hypothetical protein
VDIVIAVLAASAFLAAAILLIGRAGSLAGGRGRKGGRRRGGDGSARTRSCPLCSSALEPGERVHSKLYPGKGDRIMHILGCPRCWPASETADAAAAARRICPVCGREIGREGYAVARYFERPGTPGGGARPHIHVLGCTECRK